MRLKQKIIEKLKRIDEPEIGRDIISLNLIYDLNIDNKRKMVKAKFRPKTPDCSVAIQLSLIVKMALIEIEELTGIDLVVTDHQKAKAANRYLRKLDKNLIQRQ